MHHFFRLSLQLEFYCLYLPLCMSFLNLSVRMRKWSHDIPIFQILAVNNTYIDNSVNEFLYSQSFKDGFLVAFCTKYLIEFECTRSLRNSSCIRLLLFSIRRLWVKPKYKNYLLINSSSKETNEIVQAGIRNSSQEIKNFLKFMTKNMSFQTSLL